MTDKSASLLDNNFGSNKTAFHWQTTTNKIHGPPLRPPLRVQGAGNVGRPPHAPPAPWTAHMATCRQHHTLNE